MAIKNIHKRNLGPVFEDDGKVCVRVWAPLAKSVHIRHGDDKPVPLENGADGYWYRETDRLKPGDSYVFLLNGEKELPDPASVSQPDGVHGASQALVLREFDWKDENWKNPALIDYIFYELHTGTFSPSGTFAGIIEKLDYLLDLGITALEIMPVAQFPGERNWGYDGVFPFAVQNSYGGAHGLQQLVNTCHQKGIAVVLDVVYNHLGPEGNNLPEFGVYFTDKYKTPWGNAINYDGAWCDGVRQYFIENALMWFRDFHVDALRLDAVHAIFDRSTKHILQEIKENVDALSALTSKTYHLIAECDLNDPRFINSTTEGGLGLNAQWIDEFHHALRVAGGEHRHGYYADFNGVADLAKAYRDAYVYDGRYSEERHKTFGAKTDNPGDQFVIFSQNHDQVGNRMLGERTSRLLSFEMQKVMAVVVMIAPYLPMLFMGEEWSAPSPFQYFVSHTDEELIAAVRKGRREEFSAFHGGGHPPDPESEETFERSQLPWHLIGRSKHQTMLQFYKKLITLRKSEPALRSNNRETVEAIADDEKHILVLKRWTDGQQVLCLLNFSKTQQTVTATGSMGWQKLFASSDPEWSGEIAMPGNIHEKNITVPAESATIYTQYNV